jgi:hypothetical protein
MHDQESSFRSALGPAEVLQRFRRLAAAKGWEVTSEDEGRAHARSGLTLKSAGEDIDVGAEPEGEGSQVRVAVRSRLGAWQLIDWREAKQFHDEIVARLRA